MNRIKVLSYNIHKGVNTFGSKDILNLVHKALRDIRPDIICLQEVRGHHPTDSSEQDFESQLERLADQAWPHHAYGKNAVYRKGNHGNAVLSQFPILNTESVKLTKLPFASRGFVYAHMELPGGKPLSILSSHLGLFARERKSQMQAIQTWIREHQHDHPHLIWAGDFNDWSLKGHQQIDEDLGLSEAHLDKTGTFAKSYPSFMPLLCLDRIYYRGLELADCQVLSGSPWNQLSDHLPMVAEFSLKTPS